ncbi:hypothetical protein [Streptomyces sp. NPDC053079]|uniref:hypothetical protein n=1 Tax=Streptomyces sp. NPDC053079 TaxID=3365697 RepID=UPI0037D8BEF5
MRRTTAVALTCAGVLAVAGYGFQAQQGGDDARHVRNAAAAAAAEPRELWPQETPQSGLAQGMTLPLERYLVAYPDDVAYAKAKYTLDRACMAGFGLALNDPKPGFAPPPAYTSANMPRRYGVTDPAQARAHGYHLADDARAARTAAGAAAEEEQTSEDGHRVLFGGPSPTGPGALVTYNGKPVPPGGCAGQSVRALGGDLDEDLADELTGLSFEDSQKDPRVKAALAAWASCMNGKGHSVTHPTEAARTDSEQPTAQEIARATDDVACKQSTALVRTWFTVESEIQKKQVLDHHADLETARLKNAAVLRAAGEAVKR